MPPRRGNKRKADSEAVSPSPTQRQQTNSTKRSAGGNTGTRAADAAAVPVPLAFRAPLATAATLKTAKVDARDRYGKWLAASINSSLRTKRETETDEVWFGTKQHADR